VRAELEARQKEPPNAEDDFVGVMGVHKPSPHRPAPYPRRREKERKHSESESDTNARPPSLAVSVCVRPHSLSHRYMHTHNDSCMIGLRTVARLLWVSADAAVCGDGVDACSGAGGAVRRDGPCVCRGRLSLWRGPQGHHARGVSLYLCTLHGAMGGTRWGKRIPTALGGWRGAWVGYPRTATYVGRAKPVRRTGHSRCRWHLGEQKTRDDMAALKAKEAQSKKQSVHMQSLSRMQTHTRTYTYTRPMRVRRTLIRWPSPTSRFASACEEEAGGGDAQAGREGRAAGRPD
jgi:hypothetical protein